MMISNWDDDGNENLTLNILDHSEIFVRGPAHRARKFHLHTFHKTLHVHNLLTASERRKSSIKFRRTYRTLVTLHILKTVILFLIRWIYFLVQRKVTS
jgi:hypothetical protein